MSHNRSQATRLMMIHSLSPLHAGTGQSVADIDLPIARETATGLPYLPGSSVKGVLRDACSSSSLEKETCTDLFGPESSAAQGSLYAGMLQFTDMHVVLMPIRSLAGTFAWVTSPYALRRFARTAKETGFTNLPSIPEIPNDTCVVPGGSSLSFQYKSKQTVGIEDLVYSTIDSNNEAAFAWAEFIGERCFNDQDWRNFLMKRFCLVSDTVFSFLLKTATEITARISINSETKTVKRGGLWYEEALPTETILAGMVASSHLKTHEKVTEANDAFNHIQHILDKALQFGGNATVGRGLCNVMLDKGGQ